MATIDTLARPGSGAVSTAEQLARPRPRSLRAVAISGGFTLAILLVAFVGPLFVADPINGDVGQRLLDVGTPGHPLGTDAQGRDLLARLINGARPSILAGLIPVLIANLLGVTLGLLASQSGRRVHTAIMRTLDVFFAFPAVLLAIAIAAALGGGIQNLVIALTVVMVPAVARVTEIAAVRVRDSEFIESARASGANRLAIAFRHVLPIVGPSVIAYSTSLVGLSIIYAGGLSFLGLGIAPPQAEWGRTINELQAVVFTKPLLALAPALVFVVTSVAFNALGNALGRYFDVKDGDLR